MIGHPHPAIPMKNPRSDTQSKRVRGSLVLLPWIAALLLPACGTRLATRPDGPGLAGTPAHYGELTASRPMACSAPRIFETGPAIREEMRNLIASADDYILISSFLLTADADTEVLLEALQQKQDDGVRVLVLADSCARYKPGGKDAFRFLEEGGIAVAEFNPIRLHKLPVAPVMLPRDHRKFWIVDGETLFLGGANLYSASLRAPEDGGNLDLMVTLESAEAIEPMIASFVATWNRASKRTLDAGDFAVRSNGTTSTNLWLSDQNRDVGRGGHVAAMFNALFDLAEEEIWLVQPYAFVTKDMLQVFRDLQRRGVTVNVMLSDEVEAPRFHYASYYGIKEIIEAGGKVWIHEGGEAPLHSKAVIVDRRWASIGSANLNFRSLHLAKEANLIFGDPVSLEKVAGCLDRLIAGCREVGMEEAEAYRGARYRLAWMIMQWLG